jgi:predicted permease
MEFLFGVPSVRDGATLWRARVGGNSHVGAEQFRLLRESNLFKGVAGYREDGEINWRLNGETRSLPSFRVSDNFFDVAGIPMARGRGIQPGDEDGVVISHAMWRSKLAADPEVIGRVLELDGRPHRVIGLLPEDHRSLFGFGLSADLYAPVRGNVYSLMLVIRGAESLTQPALLERLHAGARRLDEALPERNFKYVQDCRMEALQGFDRFKGRSMMGVAAFFAMLLTVAGLLLLIACINVSNLVLARGSARVQEFAVRASLGAGRWRLVRQMLTESLLLAGAGAIAGLAINLILTRMLNRIPLDLPVQLVLRMEPDWRLIAYASLLSVGCAAAVGLLPALRISRGELGVAMKTSLGGRLTLRRALVVVQVAVSIVVLTAAVLFARNLAAAAGVEPGFDLENTMYVKVRLTPDHNQDAAKKAALADRMQREIEALPGVRAMALTMMIPMNDDATHGGTLQRDGGGERAFMRYHFNRVGPGYFATIGVSLAAGREFSPKEPANSIVINESFARQFFGGGSPLGRTVDQRVVVGVVRDSKYGYLSDHMRPALFRPYEMAAGEGRGAAVQWMVSTEAEPAALVNAVRGRLTAIDDSASIEVRPMRSAMGMAMLPSQAGGALLGAMGALGLALTGIGVYGVLAFSVARRVREIGLRVALGAGPAPVIRLVLRECASLIGIGLAVGLLIAVFITKPLAAFLVPDVSTTDPVTYAAVALLLLVAGVAASIIPARRALRVDPMVALRYE